MESPGGNRAVTSEDVASLARTLGLSLDAERFEELAELLSPALEAVDRVAVAAARVDLERALVFDPGWPDQERDS